MKFVKSRLGALTVVAGAAVLGATGTASAAPSLWVSQTSGVSAGQTVSVSLSGITADLGSVAIGQCKSSVSSVGDCNLAGGLLGKADGAGKWVSNKGTNAITLVGSLGGANCAAAPGTCSMVVTSLNNPYNILATVPLTFG
ncbi:neocarzinostatin apoprotein domain-containing protein [Nocardia higoensis]|uniref:neocarzinostatin apoprotein domain-containing protein n=1 Tax=Nocardia higoensis TaxID=228599 RepID=UPI0002F0C121|nr:neocarzinostatin apoprotein domain-containing protein [Nocardia higoensis]